MLLDEVSDDLLISLFREGNQIAIDLLYERYNVFLFGFIHQQVNINNLKCDYNELFQEMMVVFLGCIEKYDEDNGCFYYFVKKSAERRLSYLMSKMRRYNKIASLDSFVYEDGAASCVDFVAEQADYDYRDTELYKCIKEKLNVVEMKIIDMKIEGYSYDEISDFLHTSKQAVYRKISRLKNIIKDIIEKID